MKRYMWLMNLVMILMSKMMIQIYRINLDNNIQLELVVRFSILILIYKIWCLKILNLPKIFQNRNCKIKNWIIKLNLEMQSKKKSILSIQMINKISPFYIEISIKSKIFLYLMFKQNHQLKNQSQLFNLNPHKIYLKNNMNKYYSIWKQYNQNYSMNQKEFPK
jgi:hypothetical protein